MKSTDSVGRSRKPVSATEALEVRSLPRTHVPLYLSFLCARASQPATHERERSRSPHCPLAFAHTLIQTGPISCRSPPTSCT